MVNPNKPASEQTIREHFAAMAMMGLLANTRISEMALSQGCASDQVIDWLSNGAVKHADSLIAELAKDQP